jgi:ribonuclease HII
MRSRAFAVITSHADVGIGIVCAEAIDQWNILRATLTAMQRAIDDLETRADLILVDGMASPAVTIPCWPIVHGDQRSYVIACASIAAKVVRDRLMEFYHDLYPAYAFDQHKGYGTSVHAKRLAKFGPSFLHRRSFSPVAEILHAKR